MPSALQAIKVNAYGSLRNAICIWQPSKCPVQLVRHGSIAKRFNKGNQSGNFQAQYDASSLEHVTWGIITTVEAADCLRGVKPTGNSSRLRLRNGS